MSVFTQIWNTFTVSVASSDIEIHDKLKLMCQHFYTYGMRLMKIVIEGQDMKNINDFHLYLKETLGFPEYYGMNLDALWDMLTGWVDLPLTIEWKNFESSENNLGEDAFRILDVFKEAEQEIDGFKLVFN